MEKASKSGIATSNCYLFYADDEISARYYPVATFHGSKKKHKKHKKNEFPRLRIYEPNGTFYTYFKSGEGPIKRSLDTSVRSIAELRLRDLKALHRGRGKSVGETTRKVLTFGDVLKSYEHEIAKKGKIDAGPDVEQLVGVVTDAQERAKFLINWYSVGTAPENVPFSATVDLVLAKIFAKTLHLSVSLTSADKS